MRQYSQRDFVKILKRNGYSLIRHKGSHSIYYNEKGNHISIPKTIKSVIAQRLIKENNLK